MNTMQQEFDAVVAHLFKQGRPAKDGKACKYRADDGTMCAVGCRIPNSVYRPEMDIGMGCLQETDVYSLLEEFGHVLPREIAEYKKMFSMLQDAHDTCKLMEDGSFAIDALKEELAAVALKHNLEFKPEAYASN